MIDRTARDAAAQALRSFINGKMTNFAFEGLQPQTEDPAIHAIWDTCWLYYDDFKEHRLERSHTLTEDERKACVRWIIFLHNDLEYKWPLIRHPGSEPSPRSGKGFWRKLLSLNFFDQSEEEVIRFLNSGHYAVWPFISLQDYKHALRSPRLLSGQQIA